MTVALWDAHSSRSNDLSVHARLIPQDIFAFYGNQMMTEMDMQSLRSSLARSAEQLFDILELVALAVEGSDLSTAEDP